MEYVEPWKIIGAVTLLLLLAFLIYCGLSVAAENHEDKITKLKGKYEE